MHLRGYIYSFVLSVMFMREHAAVHTSMHLAVFYLVIGLVSVFVYVCYVLFVISYLCS